MQELYIETLTEERDVSIVIQEATPFGRFVKKVVLGRGLAAFLDLRVNLGVCKLVLGVFLEPFVDPLGVFLLVLGLSLEVFGGDELGVHRQGTHHEVQDLEWDHGPAPDDENVDALEQEGDESKLAELDHCHQWLVEQSV